MSNKIFNLVTSFKAADTEDGIHITGMASTADKDRMGDVINADAWSKGLTNFRNNPVILFNHDHNRPIGRAKSVTPVANGLQLEAVVSSAAGEVAQLIKEEVLGAFSVGFMVKDAEYDSDKDIFFIKEAELLEVSVVSIPANQAATFSIKKSFDNQEDYQNYIKDFSVNQASGHLADNSNDALAGETPEGDSNEAQFQEKKMDENEIRELMKQVAQDTAKAVTTAGSLARAEEKAAELAATEKAAQEAEAKKQDETRIAAVVKSGAEELVKDLTEKFAEKEADFQNILGEFRSEISEKSEEIQAMRDSRFQFSDRKSTGNLEDMSDDLVNAHILGTITQKGWGTKFGASIIEKATNADAGVQLGSSTEENFETIVSTQIERDIELELVLAPMFRSIQMNAASMVIPTMPDAGYAEFLVANAAGSGDSGPFKGNLEPRGAAVGSPYGGVTMGSKVLTVEKIISKSYIANETDEDAILPILPLIRESMVRAHARSVEHSVLMGGQAGDLISSQYTGLVKLSEDDTKQITLAASPTQELLTASSLFEMRKIMGKYGRRPSDVVYIVSLEGYYDLIDDPEFQNLNEVGARATKIVGEIGQVFGSAVVVCDEFPEGKTGANPCAVAVNTRNFVVPVLRGATVEQDYDVENQRRVLVATQRRGFDRLFAQAGQVVSTTW